MRLGLLLVLMTSGVGCEPTRQPSLGDAVQVELTSKVAERSSPIALEPRPAPPSQNSCADLLTGMPWGSPREDVLAKFPTANRELDIDCVEPFDLDGSATRMCFLFRDYGLDRIILVALACGSGSVAAPWEPNATACQAAERELTRAWQRRKNATPDDSNESGQMHWKQWREGDKGGSVTRLLYHHETRKPVAASLVCARDLNGD